MFGRNGLLITLLCMSCMTLKSFQFSHSKPMYDKIRRVRLNMNEVEVIDIQGTSHFIEVDSDEVLLDAIEKNEINAPSSCRTGLCTECAALVKNGLENIEFGAAILDPEVSAQGYVLTCSVSVNGPGVKLELGKHEEMYEAQYGIFRNDHEEAQRGSKKSGIPLPNISGA